MNGARAVVKLARAVFGVRIGQHRGSRDSEVRNVVQGGSVGAAFADPVVDLLDLEACDLGKGLEGLGAGRGLQALQVPVHQETSRCESDREENDHGRTEAVVWSSQLCRHGGRVCLPV
jgi:hypothetical protein